MVVISNMTRLSSWPTRRSHTEEAAEYDAYPTAVAEAHIAIPPLLLAAVPARAGAGAAASSVDPNGLIGPAGFGTQAFVAPGTVLPYEIDFENSPTATAPAQEVTISDPLESPISIRARSSSPRSPSATRC